MLSYLTRPFSHLARWFQSRALPPGVIGAAGTSFLDDFRQHRAPTPEELINELKNTAWTCANINASVCASFPPRLYVTTSPRQPAARCQRRSLPAWQEHQLKSAGHLARYTTAAAQIEEVTEHPLLDLLRKVNSAHNAWDLWELTTLYQETIGSAYWLLVFDALGRPSEIWPLPAQNVRPCRSRDSGNIVDFYQYRTNDGQSRRFSPDEIIHFRYPDPRDPYRNGLSPLRAAAEQVMISSEYHACKRAMIENNAIPSAIISPQEVLGEDERHRIEELWNQRFRRGGTGRVIVCEQGLQVSLLNHSMGDLAALAEYGQTRQDIANAFGVPISYLTAETNLANLGAAQTQHMQLAIRPRLHRRDQKINETLIPLFDDSGRLFVASEDPVPANQDQQLRQQEVDLKLGVKSINKVRAERGLPPVDWGEKPWLPLNWAPTDHHYAVRVEDLQTDNNHPPSP
jgi:HK97 family phage portal protein